MKVYRVSELVNPKSGYTSLTMEVAAFEGKKIHAALANKYAGRGQFIEQLQVCFLTKRIKDSSFSSILGILSGHPDRGYVDGKTLHIIDWKTISPKGNPAPKDGWGNQEALYAHMVLLNNPHLGIKKVVLSLLVFIRQGSLEEILTKYTEHTFTTTPAVLKSKVISLFPTEHGPDVTLVPYTGGIVKHD